MIVVNGGLSVGVTAELRPEKFTASQGWEENPRQGEQQGWMPGGRKSWPFSKSSVSLECKSGTLLGSLKAFYLSLATEESRMGLKKGRNWMRLEF